MTDIMIDDLTLELVTRNQIQLDNKIPDQSTENEQAAADAVQNKPGVVDLRLKITPERGRFVTVLTDEQKEQSIQSQWDRLKQIRDERELFEFTSPELVFERAQIMSLGLVEQGNFSYDINVSIKRLLTPDEEESQQEENQAGRRSDQETDDESVDEKASEQNIIKLDFSSWFESGP